MLLKDSFKIGQNRLNCLNTPIYYSCKYAIHCLSSPEVAYDQVNRVKHFLLSWRHILIYRKQYLDVSKVQNYTSCYFAEVDCLKRKLSSKLSVDEEGSVLEWEVNAFSYVVHCSIFVECTNSQCLGGRMHWNVVEAWLWNLDVPIFTTKREKAQGKLVSLTASFEFCLMACS